MSAMRRVPTIWIAQDTTLVTPEQSAPTPANTTDKGLGGLLDRVSARLTRPGGTILITAEIAAALDIPVLDAKGKAKKPPRTPGSQAAAIESARRHGWTIPELRPWTAAHRIEKDGQGRNVRRNLHIGVLPWLGRSNHPLAGSTPADTMDLHHRYHALTGVVYHGDHAGLPGLDLVRQLPRATDAVPRWVPDWTGIEPAFRATELPDTWTSSTPHGLRYEHGYDVRQQYLSAAGVARLALDQLEFFDGPTELSRENRPGYYQITVPTWEYHATHPHPAGVHRPETTVWVAAPTLDLLYEVSELGLIAAPDVHASWTANGARVLRGWSDHLAKCLKSLGDDDVVIRGAIKATYAKSIGLLGRDGGMICRHDWQHTIIAQARVNLWRKTWTEYTRSGRVPASVGTDTVFYPSNDQDPYAAESWPTTFKCDGSCRRADHHHVPGSGRQGGTFKWGKETRVLDAAQVSV